MNVARAQVPQNSKKPERRVRNQRLETHMCIGDDTRLQAQHRLKVCDPAFRRRAHCAVAGETEDEQGPGTHFAPTRSGGEQVGWHQQSRDAFASTRTRTRQWGWWSPSTREGDSRLRRGVTAASPILIPPRPQNPRRFSCLSFFSTRGCSPLWFDVADQIKEQCGT